MPEIDTQVFMPRGTVTRNAVLQAALAQVRSEIPGTVTVDARITGHDRREDDHEEPGTEYTVTVSYGHVDAPINHNVFGGSGDEDDDEDDQRDGIDRALDELNDEAVDQRIRKAMNG